MEDFHANLPKKDQKSLEHNMFTRFLRCTFYCSSSLQKAFKFMGQNAIPASAITQNTHSLEIAQPL